MLVYKELETERLILRYPLESDYTYHYNYLSNKKNFPFADIKVATSINDVKEFINRIADEHAIKHLFWMICIKETNQPIGTLSAWNIDFDEMTMEFGYSLYP